jgi:HlyD family secretion protein
MLKMLRRPRVIVGLVIVGLLVALAAWPATVPVTTVRASKGQLTVTIDEDGRTRVRDRFIVTAPVAGELMRITLQPGDRVERGRAVASIRPALHRDDARAGRRRRARAPWRKSARSGSR